MKQTIKAIETQYKGYRFRSRLEARWAVCFDAMNLTWRYETEGFNMNGVRYLPDFFLPDIDGGCYIEIKPDQFEVQALDKCLALASGLNCSVWLVSGTPDLDEHTIIRITGNKSIHARSILGSCRRCDSLWLLGEDEHGQVISGCCVELHRNPQCYCDKINAGGDRLLNGFTSAKSARFENF